MTTLGYKFTREQRDRISEAMMGNTNNLGKYFPEERKKKIREKNGYIFLRMPVGHRFSCMRNSEGFVKISRLMMAEYLQRPLTKEEVAHHINGDITDNRIENLRLFKNKGEHMAYHHKLEKIKGELVLCV